MKKSVAGGHSTQRREESGQVSPKCPRECLGGGLGPGSWLDLAWTRPLELNHEFVPASDLGVWVVLAGGRAIVTSVQVRRGR